MKRADRLKRMLAPARVAWFGSGGIAPAIGYMKANGFMGEAIAVNPRRAEIAGLPCVPSAADLPWAPDIAILVIPKEAVIGTVRVLAARGCGGVVCIASGFSESAEGADREAALVAAAGGMPVIGPSCPGIANFLDGNAFMMNHFGNHAPEKGVAVISNGGAYLSDLGCADRSQPIAYLIGLGNQAMVSVADMLDAVLEDPRVTAVNVYFEGIADAGKLSQAAAYGAARGKMDPDAMLLSDEGSARPGGEGEKRPPHGGAGRTLPGLSARRDIERGGGQVLAFGGRTGCSRSVGGQGPEGVPDIPCTCALKAIVPGLLHKTEAGAVALNIAPEDLPAAVRSMTGRLAEQGLEAEGCLIEEMIQGPVAELLAGMRREPDIGRTLTLAIGGIAVELMQATAALILPAPRADIEAALKGLKLAPLILGYSGRPAADLAAALDAIEVLCAFAAGNPEIAELEVNPLLLTQSRAVVADAVLTLKG